MTLEEKIFKSAVVDFFKLKQFGFKKQNNEYIYRKNFMNDTFEAVIKVDEKGRFSGEVYETDSGEIYIPLRVESMASGFVGEVRKSYELILENIKLNCCNENYFCYEQANRLTSEIYEKYGDKPCFPWDKFEGYGVFKNQENNKWYALVMTLDFGKLDEEQNGEIEVVNLKLNKDKIAKLIGEKGFYPAYHMNKKNWITVTLNDFVADELLFELLDESHSFTLGKRK